MIRQVRFTEVYTTTGSMFRSTRRVFGFGTHEMATETDAHPVNTAAAKTNFFRIVMDELLVGNHLEEIACRAAVDADADGGQNYARVPLGTTPDDIARCSAAQDILPETCQGEHAVCLCDLPAGCPVGMDVIAQGAPVGVLDINQDGSADDTRFIRDAVSLSCTPTTGGTAIVVPIDLDMSYWNPSGNQQVPAMGGFEALGPAIVLTPQRGLPTNTNCELVFAADVVDKQGDGVCAPANGDVEAGCNAGELGEFATTTEALDIIDFPFTEGMTGVNRMDPLVFIGNVNFDTTTINATNITVTPAPPAAPTISTVANMNDRILISWPQPLAASTEYTVTFTTDVKDTFGQGLPQQITFTFTTGA